MKKFILLSFFGIFLYAGAQGQTADFKMKVDSFRRKPLKTLQVTIFQGKPDFTISIYKIDTTLNDPFSGIKRNSPVAKQNGSQLTTYTFPNLENGTYYIEVTDKTKLPKGKSITF